MCPACGFKMHPQDSTCRTCINDASKLEKLKSDSTEMMLCLIILIAFTFTSGYYSFDSWRAWYQRAHYGSQNENTWCANSSCTRKATTTVSGDYESLHLVYHICGTCDFSPPASIKSFSLRSGTEHIWGLGPEHLHTDLVSFLSIALPLVFLASAGGSYAIVLVIRKNSAESKRLAPLVSEAKAKNILGKPI